MSRVLLPGLVAAVLAAGCGGNGPPATSTVPSAEEFFDKKPRATEVPPPGSPGSS